MEKRRIFKLRQEGKITPEEEESLRNEAALEAAAAVEKARKKALKDAGEGDSDSDDDAGIEEEGGRSQDIDGGIGLNKGVVRVRKGADGGDGDGVDYMYDEYSDADEGAGVQGDSDSYGSDDSEYDSEEYVHTRIRALTML